MPEHNTNKSRREFIRIKTQSEYPSVDLTDSNAEVLRHILPDDNGIEAQAKYLEEFQHPVFALAQRAFDLLSDIKSDEKPTYSESEYRSFAHGFSSLEAIITMIRPPQVYGTEIAAKQLTKTLIDPRSGFEIEMEAAMQFEASDNVNSDCTVGTHEVIDVAKRLLGTDAFSDSLVPTRDLSGAAQQVADRYKTWADRRPNTADVISTIGKRKHESPRQLNARLIGAHAAHFLQDTSAG